MNAAERCRVPLKGRRIISWQYPGRTNAKGAATMPSRREFLGAAIALPALALPSPGLETRGDEASRGLKTPGYTEPKTGGSVQPAVSPRRGPKIGTVTYNIAKDWD